MVNLSKRLKIVFAIVLVIVLGWGITFDGLPTSKSVGLANSDYSESPSQGEPMQHTVSLAVAQRQGRCRALKYHLNEMAQAESESDVEARRRSLGLLVGEMMNGYSAGGAGSDPSSNALPIVHTPEGQLDLSEARNAFRETLRSVKGMNGREAAKKLSESCMACHSHFRRDGGQRLSLFTGASTD